MKDDVVKEWISGVLGGCAWGDHAIRGRVHDVMGVDDVLGGLVTSWKGRQVILSWCHGIDDVMGGWVTFMGAWVASWKGMGGYNWATT